VITVTRQKVMAKLHSFPAMPGTAVTVMRLLSDPSSSAATIEKAVRYDPGLTANILKFANSAYFGYAQRIGSVRQGIVRLGWKRVYQLVVASCVNGVMSKPVPGYDLAPGELWRHCVGVSVASEQLMKRLRMQPSEETFTAALLHDVGKLIMGAFVEEGFARIEVLAQDGLSFEAAEREVVGVDHAEIGAQILGKWLLPAGLVQVVRLHHEPDKAAAPDCNLDIVHVADVLCLMLGMGTGREGLGYRPAESTMARLGLKSADLEVVASSTLQGVQELSEVIDAPADDPWPVAPEGRQ
jgi:putative nucleotidyltransferase with HDIG domain